ncbi:MAG: Asp23/Gls24 family envelope stress response protein [Clostridia bacterium]|nr:Asp23/Gls24 family envelope stress response protein [Clostridiales bacterium]MBQ3505880.1 Asp23/Gls24 family envelope stress response protein [Clostridia bacterium]
MFNIKLNPKDGENGKVVYNAGIVHNIVALAIAEVEGALLVQGKRNGISLYLEKDGIYADVSVVVKQGYNVPELAYRIQQSVKQSVENMTKYKVAEVDVHVRDVVFDQVVPAEKEEEEEPATETQEN